MLNYCLMKNNKEILRYYSFKMLLACFSFIVHVYYMYIIMYEFISFLSRRNPDLDCVSRHNFNKLYIYIIYIVELKIYCVHKEHTQRRLLMAFEHSDCHNSRSM